MMIDIIIPIYNSKKTLEKTLDSIYNQTIKEKINVIIVDDHSKDDYANIINKYSNLNIKYIKHSENKGAGISRQTGLNNSNGKYIIFLDSDDLFYTKDSVQLLYNEIELGYDYVDSVVYDEYSNINYYSDSDLHGKIYLRKFIEDKNIQFNATRYHEDNAFNNIVLINNPLKSKLTKTTYIYSYNNLSLTQLKSNKELENIETYIYNMNYVIDNAKNNNCLEELITKYLTAKYNYLNNLIKKLNYTEKNKINDLLIKYGFDKI